MSLQTKLVQNLGQSLMMTPQLQQAIKLLQLGRLEFLEAIEKELIENPILEESRDDESLSQGSKETEIFTLDENTSSSSFEDGTPEGPNSAPEAKTDWDGYLDIFTDSSGSAAPKGSNDFEDRPSLEATLTKTETLIDFITEQIRFLNLSDQERITLLHIIGNLDRNGFLCCSYEELASDADCSLEEITDLIDIVKTLEPAGVGARDLQECLLFQLERVEKHNELEGRIVRNHLDKVEKRRLDLIAKEEACTLDQVKAAINIIRLLEPWPGRQFAEDSTRYIVPDIYVSKVGKDYVISLNDDGIPRLRVSPYYMNLMKESAFGDKDSKTYIQERVKSATWLIRSIHQRQQTIYKVTEAVISRQRDFLDSGIDHLKPLVLKEIADQIGMHESTVSRVTTNKYVHTPQGVFELKFFFTNGIKTDSGEISSSSLKERIKNLIAAEPENLPLSDQQIAEILKDSKINIARRTVAKYRESLGIPSSAQRKRAF